VKAPKVGEACVFRSPYKQHHELNGCSCTVKRIIDKPDRHHDPEVLPMYVVEFGPPKKTIEAWPEELVRP
jgi:hypothetical protein